MKTILTIVLLCTFFMSGAHAQVPPGSQNNTSIYMGHIIRLISAGSNGFGYDIFFKSKIVVHQARNPFTLAPTGLRSSDDALKVARWQIKQLWHDKNHAAILNNHVSLHVARQLSISTN